MPTTAVHSMTPSSPTSIVSTPIPVHRSLRADERRIGSTLWRRLGHQSVYRNCKPSPVWSHGDLYVEANKPRNQPHFICDYCDSILKVPPSRATSNYRRHLNDRHQIVLNEVQEYEGGREQEVAPTDSISVASSTQYAALCTTINMEKFRLLLLRLFVHCQLSYNLIEQSEFRELLQYIQPTIDRYLPSRNTIRTWVMNEFGEGRDAVRTAISTAKSRVHISFDMWTAPMGTPILGICAHFLNNAYELVHPLLALRFLAGHHTGLVMAEVIEAVMYEFGIVDKWGVCVADNADNNDTCVAALVNKLRPGEDTTARRSRCFAHMVNLAAKAFIYGKKAEGFLTEAHQVMTLSNRDQTAVQTEMKLWRTRGSFGKFHNFVKYVKASSLRRQKLDSIIQAISQQINIEGGMEDVGGGTGLCENRSHITTLTRLGPISASLDEIYRPVHSQLTLKLDNATRWNSAFLSIQRGLRLREAIKMYLASDEEMEYEDFLTEDDWAQLEAIYHGLKPFWETIMRLEGHGHLGSHGVVWEVLPGLELLLSHVESRITELSTEQASNDLPLPRRPGRATQQPTHHRPPTEPLLVCYQNAWDLLTKYNNLTDRNHEIYAAATLLNPCVRRQYFDKSWTGNAADQIELMIQKNRGVWENNYRQDMPVPVSEAPKSILSAYMYNLCATSQLQNNDDFQRYVNGHVTQWIEWKDNNLFYWWSTCEFPGLRQWALDTLSIPAMSAELERVFSQAKQFYSDDRNRLSTTTFEALQCLLQWHRQSIYNMNMDTARNNYPPANQVAAARVDS